MLTAVMPDWSIDDPELPPVVTRPVGVTVAGYIMIGFGCVSVVLGCLLGTVLGNGNVNSWWSWRMEQVVVLVPLLMIFAVVNGVFGYRILQGKQRARIASIVLYCIADLGAVVGVERGISLLSMVLYLAPISLINTRSARAYFRNPA
jgi:hypothetical protein